MSMRTWNRKIAHEKAERAGVDKPNKKQIFNGKIWPSKFAMNWRRWAQMPVAKKGV